MKFNYAGITKDGRHIKGTLDAADEVEAKMRLRAMQVRPEKLFAAPEKKGGLFGLVGGASEATPKKSVNRYGNNDKEKKDLLSLEINLTSPVTLKSMIIFTRQFSSLIDAGIAIVQCLDILSAQERKKGFKRILLQVKEDIESGSGLAEALQRHPRAFSDFFVRIVEAGEVSGTLDAALKRIGLQLEKLARIRRAVVSAFMMPAMTIVVAMGVLIFLLVKVIPQVAQLYSQSSAELPEITQTVLDLSNFFQTNYTMLVGSAISLVITSMFLYKIESFREVFDPIWLKVPLFGTLTRKAAVGRFARTMSTLIQSGVPLLAAFDICRKLMSNLAVKNAIDYTAAAVSEGKSIASGLADTKIFPPMVVHMISIGEMTGRLDDLLGKVADIYDDEVDDAIANITGLLQPTLIVCVGILILFLLLAMYMPIFQLGERTSGG